MPCVRPSDLPAALEPRAKALGKASGTWARKSAMEAREAERLNEERLMAKALVLTMASLGVTNVKLGEWLGISERVVRDLRIRERALQGRQIAKLPEHFRAALLLAFDDVLRPKVANDV
jgi:hypothetical protein